MPQLRRNNMAQAPGPAAEGESSVNCCTPSGCLHESSLIEELSDSVKVICNNEACTRGEYMHSACFEVWEASVLTFLRTCGRARSWSDKQRLQNLWTKKGYDLAFKACNCLCGRGHLRKDLDWTPPKPAPMDLEAEAKRKKKNRAAVAKATPIPVVSAGRAGGSSLFSNGNGVRARANSLSSGSSGSSGSGSPPELSSSLGQLSLSRRSNGNSARERHVSESSGLFAHRVDFSNFNVLPRHKLNSHHIKMEDEGSFGNDDIRCFILSNLASARMSRAYCVICHNGMVIFDRYPIIDGTFFLTPKQYSKSCIPVTTEGRQQYLSAVCMACLEGWTSSLACRFCGKRWDGSSLILGTMYSYDIFAAVPCCRDRLRCNSCSSLVVSPEHRFPYFSYYSRELLCPHCSDNQPHFVKSLPSIYRLVSTTSQTSSP